jgi:outer membrane protein OmpA-like peptidoglycan-associated protein
MVSEPNGATMPLRKLALSLALATVAGTASAQTPGPYVAAVGGGDLEQQPSVRLGNTVGASTGAIVGYAFPSGLRAEFEGDYVGSQVPDARPLVGTFANVVYQLGGLVGIHPYFGIGLGYQEVSSSGIRTADGGFATQGILGADYPIRAVPGDASTTPGEGAPIAEAALLGFRYALGTTRVPVATPAPEWPQSAQRGGQETSRFLVFFDWDRSNLSERGRQIVASAAVRANSGRPASIDVQGYEDTSGGVSYVKFLTRKRGGAVVAELVRNGVPRESVTLSGAGMSTESSLPTGKVRVSVILH